MIIASAYNWSIERLAYKPLRGSFRLAPLISAIGMSIVLQEFVRIAQEGRPKPIQPMITGSYEIAKRVNESGEFIVKLSNMQIIIIISTLVLMGVFTALIQRTSLGRAQRSLRAGHENVRPARHRCRPHHFHYIRHGAALAAFAGMMFFLYYGVTDFFVGFLAGIKAFTAAVLGGIGSIPGAMLGGLISA